MDKRSIFEIIVNKKKHFFDSHYNRAEQKFIKKVYIFCCIGKSLCYFLRELIAVYFQLLQFRVREELWRLQCCYEMFSSGKSDTFNPFSSRKRQLLAAHGRPRIYSCPEGHSCTLGRPLEAQKVLGSLWSPKSHLSLSEKTHATVWRPQARLSFLNVRDQMHLVVSLLLIIL